MTKLAHCLWCAAPFTAKKVGAHQKRFCSSRCKNRYHAAARKWADRAFSFGLLSIFDLKAAEASCTRRRVAEAGKTVPFLYPFSETPESLCEPTSEGTSNGLLQQGSHGSE